MKKGPENRTRQDLNEMRKKIDLIDRRLLSLLNQRMRLALELRKIKKESGKKIYDPKREKELLDRLKSLNAGPLQEEELKRIFQTVIKVCRQAQQP